MGFVAAGFAVDPPLTSPVGSPIGDPTVPPTSARNELIQIEQPDYGAEGNLIVTGNVAGGRHFRHFDGILPYRSTADFYPSDLELATGSDSASLNSFIRRSAGTGYTDFSLGLGEPYYLPSQTVTSLTRGGQPGLSAPKVYFPGGTGDFAPPPLPADTQFPYGQQRPMSRSMEELERIISREIELQKLKHQEDDSSQEEMGELDKLIEKMDAELLDKSTEIEDGKAKFLDDTIEPPEPDKPPEPTPEQDEQEQPEDPYEELLKEMDEEQAEDTSSDVPEQAGAAEDKQNQGGESPLKVGEQKKLTEVDHATAAAIRGSHKTFESWAKAKFAEYMQAATEFLKQGKFYKAADAYTLASVYDLKNPVPYGGKALALFAAGEYMSSSFFLQKAIMLSPEFAKRRVNMIALLVDKDMIENRIIELATFQQRSKSPALAFLMAYVFYQSNNRLGAQQAINLASQGMGDSPALIVLKKAIETPGSGAR